MVASKIVNTAKKVGTRGKAVKASEPTKQEKIISAVKKQGQPKAEKEFGANAVRQAVRREKAKLEKQKAQKKKEREEKIGKSSAAAAPSVRKKKMTKQQKAEAAYKRFQNAKSKAKKVESVKDFIKRGGEISELPTAMEKFYRKEVAKELKGQTSKPLRDLRQKATDKRKKRQARKLTEGRESTEAFEARMAKEARSTGVEDVGRRRSQRGSSPDPLYEYERSQAESFLRGRDEAPMEVDDLLKMYEGRKKGGTIGRGMGKALRGGGRVKG